jgi:hypothetical protein
VKLVFSCNKCSWRAEYWVVVSLPPESARAPAPAARAREVSNQGESFGKAGARMSDYTQPGH